MKQCSGCKEIKTFDEFSNSKHHKDGLHNNCRKCRKEICKKWRTNNARKKKKDDQEYRLNNPEKFRKYVEKWRNNNPEKTKAHIKVRSAIKKGLLTPTKCEKCESTEKIEAHHPDYAKPLEVMWLCRKCHKKIHIE